MLELLTNEPVLTGAVASILATVAARYGLHLSADTLAGVASLVGAAVAVVVRRFVSPTKATAPPVPVGK